MGDVDAVPSRGLFNPHAGVHVDGLCGREVGGVELRAEPRQVGGGPFGQVEGAQHLGPDALPGRGCHEEAAGIAPSIGADHVDVTAPQGEPKAVQHAQGVGTPIDPSLDNHERAPGLGDDRTGSTVDVGLPNIEGAEVVQAGDHGMAEGDGGEADPVEQCG